MLGRRRTPGITPSLVLPIGSQIRRTNGAFLMQGWNQCIDGNFAQGGKALHFLFLTSVTLWLDTCLSLLGSIIWSLVCLFVSPRNPFYRNRSCYRVQMMSFTSPSMHQMHTKRWPTVGAASCIYVWPTWIVYDGDKMLWCQWLPDIGTYFITIKGHANSSSALDLIYFVLQWVG